MFSFTSVLAAATALFATANAAPTVDWSANAPTGYGLISIRSASPVHLQSVVLRDNKVYLGGGDNATYLNGNIALYTETTTGFAIYSFVETEKNTAWLTVHDDGHLEYQYWTSTGEVTGEYSGWNWTDAEAPHLAYNGYEGAFVCEVSSGDYQLYFQTSADKAYSCPDGQTEYGIALRRV